MGAFSLNIPGLGGGSTLFSMLGDLQSGRYVYGDAGKARDSGQLTPEQFNIFIDAFNKYTGTVPGERPYSVGDVVTAPGAPTLTQTVTATPAPVATTNVNEGKATGLMSAGTLGLPGLSDTQVAASLGMEYTGDRDQDQMVQDAVEQARSADARASGIAPSKEEIAQRTEQFNNTMERLATDPAFREQWFGKRDYRRFSAEDILKVAAAFALPFAAPAVGAAIGSLTGVGALGTAGAPTLLGSTVGGAVLGGATAAATGDSIVEGVLTGGLSGGLAGVSIDPNVQNVLGGPAQVAVDTVSAPLAAVSAAGPAVMEAERQDSDLEGFQNAPVVDAVVGGVPVVLDQPPTYVEPVDQQEPEAGSGGGGSSAGGAAAPTGGAAAPIDGEVQGGVSDAQTSAQAGSEVTEGVDPVVANQILEAILSETDQNVRDGLISDWQNYTGETFNNTLLPDYQEQAPPEPVGYVWGDGVWTPVFDIPPAGSVIFEPGPQQPDYTPQEDEVVDVTSDLIDAAGGLLDSTIDADTTADIEPVDTTTVEPVDTTIVEPVDTTTVEPVDTTTVEPVDTTTVEPVDTTTDGVESGTTGGDQSVDVGGEGTGNGTGVGSGVGGGEGSGEGNGEGNGQGDGEGDGSGDGINLGTGLMAAAAGAAFEPKWTELFKYTTLTPYQKKAIAPYVDYIAQARQMQGRGMLS